MAVRVQAHNDEVAAAPGVSDVAHRVDIPEAVESNIRRFARPRRIGAARSINPAQSAVRIEAYDDESVAGRTARAHTRDINISGSVEREPVANGDPIARRLVGPDPLRFDLDLRK